MRSFTDTEATRSHVPLLVALYGPSGGGKTYSALRLATGIQRVVGGDIFVVDTESKRSTHYADQFKFRHVEFGEPFDPLSYLAAIQHCVKAGAKTVLVDSFSHEHDGPGGLLEMHTAEHKRLGGGNGTKMLAWAKPKSERRRLINTILQLDVNLIFCFRGKDKIKMEKGKDPEKMGWMPIGGEEYIYECTTSCYLPSMCDGKPQWNPESPWQREMIKLPGQFRDLLPGQQLSEDIGESMARWAAGVPKGPYKIPKGPHKGKTVDELPADYLATLAASDAVTGELRQLVESELERRQAAETPAGNNGEATDAEEAAMGGDS